MTVTIRPALTPEEWAAKMVWLDGAAAGCSIAVEPDGYVVVTNDDYYAGWTGYLTRRQAVAALCLHGQPYGFTREDVERIRRAVSRAVAEWNTNDILDDEDRALLSVAARIEALLPPTT